MKSWLLPGYILLFVTQIMLAQETTSIEARFAASNRSPLVGEPVQLTLSAFLPPGVTLVSWPDFPDQWVDFEVDEVSEIEISGSAGGGQDYQQSLSVRLWEPGSFQTPETLIAYRRVDGEVINLSVPPLTFEVPSVLETGDLSLRPLDEQIEMSYFPPALIIAIAGGLTAGLIWLIDYRRKRRIIRQPVDVTGIDRTVLANLKTIDLRVTQPDSAYATVADCLRDYITGQFDVPAHELTTVEVANALQKHLPRPLVSHLYQLMAQADLVKFAHQFPDHASAARYVDTAANWVRASAKASQQRDETEVGS